MKLLTCLYHVWCTHKLFFNEICCTTPLTPSTLKQPSNGALKSELWLKNEARYRKAFYILICMIYLCFFSFCFNIAKIQFNISTVFITCKCIARKLSMWMPLTSVFMDSILVLWPHRYKYLKVSEYRSSNSTHGMYRRIAGTFCKSIEVSRYSDIIFNK